MTNIYIDFDGVILDTWEVIFKEYQRKYNTKDIIEENLKNIMLEIGWDYILRESREINNSLKKIIHLQQNQKACILSKINSDEEKCQKRKYLLNNGIDMMCFVPYNTSKTQFVNAKDNVLIDDDLKNLNDWEEQGGISIYFNEHLNNYDSYGNKNEKFIIINDLSKIYDIIK